MLYLWQWLKDKLYFIHGNAKKVKVYFIYDNALKIKWYSNDQSFKDKLHYIMFQKFIVFGAPKRSLPYSTF